MDSWKILRDAGFNCYVIPGWQQNWGSKWKEIPNENEYARPGVVVEPGLKEHLVQAAAHGLKVIPNFLTDTRAYWILNQYKGEQQLLDELREVMTAFADDPNVLMWYPVDEWDHEDSTYGKPHAFSHLLYWQARRSSPNRASLLLNMGFHGPDVWRLTEPEADVLSVDVYPSDWDSFEIGLAKQADDWITSVQSLVERNRTSCCQSCSSGIGSKSERRRRSLHKPMSGSCTARAVCFTSITCIRPIRRPPEISGMARSK